MGRAARAVHHEQPVEREAAALRQALDAPGQLRIGQRGEFVEERGDEHRVDDQQRQVERRPERPGPDPPVRARAAHQPQHRGRQRQAQHRGHGQPLDGVGREQPRRHAVKAEAGLQPELPPQGEGQPQQAQQQGNRNQQQHLPDEVVAGKLGHRQVDELQPAHQGQAHQQDGVVSAFQHAQLDPRHGVVGRALVAGQPDPVGKLGRHLVAVARDVTDLPRRQPQAHGDIGQQEGNEQQSEHGYCGGLRNVCEKIACFYRRAVPR